MFLKRKVHRIFLLLGSGCNMNCRYCFQHPLVTKQLCTDINPKIYDFFEQLCKEQGHKVRIIFFGGEPLLYFDTIKKVVEECDKRGCCDYGITTNGSLVTKEIAEYFNEHKFSVTVSWDGKASSYTRRKDVMETNLDNILEIMKLHINCVLSSKVYPIQALDDIQELSDIYYSRHGHRFTLGLSPVRDSGIDDQDLISVDIDRLRNEMTWLTEYYLKHLETKDGIFSYMFYMDRIIRRNIIPWYYLPDRMLHLNATFCQNGINAIHLDLQGGLHRCHGISDIAATIEDDYIVYLSDIIRNSKLIPRLNRCSDCSAACTCRGGCSCIDIEELPSYCELQKAIIEPAIDTLIEAGKLTIEVK